MKECLRRRVAYPVLEKEKGERGVGEGGGRRLNARMRHVAILPSASGHNDGVAARAAIFYHFSPANRSGGPSTFSCYRGGINLILPLSVKVAW